LGKGRWRVLAKRKGAMAVSVLPEPVGARRRMFCWWRSLVMVSHWKLRGWKVVRVWKWWSIVGIL